jgi:hydrogenase expression/formation protein HypE
MTKKKYINPEDLSCPLPITRHDTVQLAHGSGGKLSNDLISKLFVWAFDNPELNKQDDNAIVQVGDLKLSFSTDSFVVDPIFFPGGDIGELAVNGTVNDVAMSGAKPLFLSCGCIVEEGFPLEDLKKVVISMKQAAACADVKIVTGDTKVVNKGKGDKIFINTSGIGIIEHNYTLGADCLSSGDIMIVSGTIADHGVCILSQREGLSFQTPIGSDTAPLNDLVQKILEVGRSEVKAMRDPTRGGLAATLNEWADSSNVGIRINEAKVPINDPVRGACEILGLDPLYVANEGKMVVAVGRDKAQNVLDAMRSHPLGKDAEIIGDVVDENKKMVSLKTRIGGWRIVDMPVGEQLPRIC